jgi:hypothetical protein
MDKEQPRCVACGGSLEGKRAGAKTCSDACRAKVSRRKRDPRIGSPERKHRQRSGLDAKYAYRQHAQASELLQRLGLVPLGNIIGPNPSRSQLERDNSRNAAYHPATHDPILWHNRKMPAGRWSPSDGWWLYESWGTGSGRVLFRTRLDMERFFYVRQDRRSFCAS